MEPLTWITVASLMVKYGPEVAEFIIRKYHARGIVTIEEWNDLKAVADKTSKSQMLDALARAGITADSEQGKALLAITP